MILGLYEAYLQEIIERSKLGLGPKPIDQGNLLEEIIDIILGPKSPNRDDAIKHFIYTVCKNSETRMCLLPCLKS